MKVYELIQALAEVDADYEVKIDFTAFATFDCPRCKEIFDDEIKDISTVDNTNYNTYGKEFYIKTTN